MGIAESAKDPFSASFVGPSCSKISPSRCTHARYWQRARGFKGGCDRRVIVGCIGGYIPGYPVPVVVLAVDDDVGYVAGCDAGPKPGSALVRLARRAEEHGYL